MGKEKKQLHACDRHRKQQNKKDLKRNKVKRKEHKFTLMNSMDPKAILSEIYRINRAEVAGATDEKMLVRRKQLIEAHKAALTKIKELEEKKNMPEEEEQVVIKGLSKIFKSIKSKQELLLTNEMDASMDDAEAKVTDDEKEETREEKKEKEGIVFSKQEQESMVFDDTLIEEVMLEVPPGIGAPPGIHGIPRPPGSILMHPSRTPIPHAPLLHHPHHPLGHHPHHPMSHHPHGHHPHHPHHPQHRQPLSDVPLGPTIPGHSINKDEPSKPSDPLDPSKPAKDISAAPMKPTATTAPKLAFMPTALLVRNRNTAPKPVRRRKPINKNKVMDEREVATRKRPQKEKSINTADAYDLFMKEMEAMGALDDEEE